MKVTSNTIKVYMTEQERETLLSADIILREFGIAITSIMPEFEKEICSARNVICTILEEEITEIK